MVDALNKYDASEHAGILAAIALATSPTPPEGRQKLKPEEEAVLAAIRDAIPGRSAGNVQTDEAILKALTNSVLHNVNVQDLLNSAGAAGRLPTSLYSVVIPDAFLQNFAPFHVRASDVLSAVAEAEDFQHLEVGDENCGTSLFTRMIVNKNGRDPYWVVAHFHRDGTNLIAHSFWRVYPSDIDLTKAETPVDLIEALVGKVGGEIVINGNKAQFFRSFRLPNEIKNYELQIPRVPLTIGTMTGANSEIDGPQIILAYGVNAERYRDYLIRHAVPVGKLPPIHNTFVSSTRSNR